MTPAQLKDIRIGLNWGMSDVARRTGYSRQHIYDVEKGRWSVTPELVNAFIIAVKKSIASQQKILQKLENNA